MARKQHTKGRNLLIPVVILYGLVAIATCSITFNTTHLDMLEQGQKPCQLINPTNDSKLEFTSSQPTPVTVVVQRYLSLSCSAQNFCDIKWLKDYSLEYPFDNLSWIQLSESNQELQLQKAYKHRKGNYTCIVTDGNVNINRTVEVFITDTPWDYPPLKLPAKTCTNQTANIGQKVEFFCFFHNGEKNYEVNMTWEKNIEVSPGVNEWQPVKRLEQSMYEEKSDCTHINRDDRGERMPTAGMHLYINAIDQEAFGYYRLVATSSLGTEKSSVLSLSELQKANLTSLIVISVSLACLLFLIVSAALTWRLKKYDFMIWRNQFVPLEEDGGKTYDAFICYADEDLQFVLSLRQNLKEAGYNVCVRDIDILAATTLVEEIIQALKDSCHCILLITPDFLTAQHSTLQVDVAVDQVIKKQLKIIPLIYRDIVAVDLGALPLLKHILPYIKSITWDPNNEVTSREQLLRRMTPRRRRNIDNIEE